MRVSGSTRSSDHAAGTTLFERQGRAPEQVEPVSRPDPRLSAPRPIQRSVLPAGVKNLGLIGPARSDRTVYRFNPYGRVDHQRQKSLSVQTTKPEGSADRYRSPMTCTPLPTPSSTSPKLSASPDSFMDPRTRSVSPASFIAMAPSFDAELSMRLDRLILAQCSHKRVVRFEAVQSPHMSEQEAPNTLLQLSRSRPADHTMGAVALPVRSAVITDSSIPGKRPR